MKAYTGQLIALGAETDSEFHLQKVLRQLLQMVVVQREVLHLVVVVLKHFEEGEGGIVQLKCQENDLGLMDKRSIVGT